MDLLSRFRSSSRRAWLAALVLAAAIVIGFVYDRIWCHVSVSGTLRLPPEWGSIDRSLELVAAESASGRAGLERWRAIQELADRRLEIPGASMRADPSVEGLFRWTVSGVVPGVYLLRNLELTVARRLDVGLGGETDVEFVVPEPAQVELEVASIETDDPETSEPLSIQWTWAPPSVPYQMLKPRDAAWDHDAKLHRFTAPVGEIRIMVDDSEMEIVRNETVVLRPGTNRVAIGVRKIED